MPSVYRRLRFSRVPFLLVSAFLCFAPLSATAQTILDALHITPEEVKQAGLEEAMDALQNGDFETAFRKAEVLAEQGNPTARTIASMAKAQWELEQREQARLAADGPIDLRDHDGRYKPDRSPEDQAQFAEGQHLYETGDYAAALQNWLPLAEAGDPEALYEVGLLYRSGKGIEANRGRGKNYILEAAKRGYAPAQGDLASSADPFGISEDEASQREAFYWAIRAAANGDAWGYDTLASAYCEGDGVDRNPVLADIWLYLIFPKKEDFLRHACNADIDLPTPYYEEIAKRADAMRRAYDIPMVPQD
ncbi:MAG: hypothetical protein Kow00114_38850 [Kiloniellaceae bacterium]